MKSMTCSQLGGACELELFGETFSEIAQQSQSHGKEMFAQNDQPHIEAMNKMMEIMNSGQMNAGCNKKKNFLILYKS